MSAAELETNTPTFRLDERLIAGRYRPQDRIGHGRLGEIFTAVDESADGSGAERQLAIQIVPEKIVHNNKLFNKLNVGYSLLRAAAHPNIVKYLHFGRHGKRGFLVMELLHGASLRSVLATAENLPPDEVKPVVRAVGGALQLLHTQEMLHGNVTASNVFFTEALDIRLLDVLPLGADQAIIRGGATSSPFSRCTVRDDVFGLACLTYEMLAGRHPFNHSPPAEAASAGLEAERIDPLTDAQWDALRLALSLDHDSRTATIADFLRDFGISGTERLEPVAAPPTRHEAPSYDAVNRHTPVPEPPPPAPVAEPVVPVTAADPVAVDVKEPPNARRSKRDGRTRRTVLLGLLLATLGAWIYVGQPQEQMDELIGRIDAAIPSGLPGLSGAAVEPATVSAEQTIVIEPVATADPPEATSVIAEVEATSADLDTPDPEPEPAAIEVAPPVASAEPDDDTALAVVPETAITAPGEATEVVVDDAAGGAGAEPIPTEPQAIFAAPVIMVNERDGAARIVAPLTGYSESPLVWWTSEHSANADEDFIRVEQTLVSQAIVDEGNVLHVPIINDSLPEPRESFFVSLGFRDLERNHIERIGTVRVDIVDDD